MLDKDNIKIIPNLPRKLNFASERKSPLEQVKLAPENEIDLVENNGAIFQAVGIINGTVNFTTDGKITVTIVNPIGFS